MTTAVAKWLAHVPCELDSVKVRFSVYVSCLFSLDIRNDIPDTGEIILVSYKEVCNVSSFQVLILGSITYFVIILKFLKKLNITCKQNINL